MDPQNTPVVPSTPQTTPIPTNVPPKTPEMNGKQKSSIGPIIGIVLIIATLALGGIYYWVTQMQKLQVVTQVEDIPTTTTTTTSTTVNDDPSAIENDLNQTNINVDANLEGTVNSEFGTQ